MDTAPMELVQTAVERLFTDGVAPVTRMSANSGQLIYGTGALHDRVFFLHSGQVRFFHIRSDLHERLACILGPGHFFGYGAMAKAQRFDFKAVASERSEISYMNVESFFARLAQNPFAMREVAAAMAGHLIDAHEDLQQLTHDDCQNRLLNKLIGLGHSTAVERCQEGVILRLTHEELASHIGMARETVSLALTQLRNKNLLRTGRNRLIYNPDVLNAFVRKSQPQSKQLSAV